MLDAQTARGLCRVRLLALRAMVAAGGRPRPSQWRRAVAPLVDAELDEADLPCSSAELHAGSGLDRGGQVEPGGDRRAVSESRAGVQRAETVDWSADTPPWM